MKRLIRKVYATSDYRTFDSYSLDELEEIYPDYYDWAADLGDVEEVFISRNDECPYIGVRYSDGSLFVYGAGLDSEVSFEELADYMVQV